MASGGEIKRLRKLDNNKSAAVVASYIGVDAEKMRKWESKNVDPVDSEDIRKVESYFGVPLNELQNLESFQFIKKGNSQPNNDYQTKYIALLEKSLLEKEKENQELKDTLNNVQASLDMILRNQSTMDATFQASIEEMAKHVAKDEAGTLLQSIYTAAAVIELDNRKMDNRLQIGNVRNL